MNTLLNINKFHYRRGGADIVYLEQSRLLRDRGWRVAEFSMHHPQNLDSEWSRYWVDEMDIDGDYSVVDRLVRAGRVVWSGQARNRLERLLDDVDVDVAHAHNIYHQLSPAILPLLHGRGIPTVLTTHDLKLACPAYQMMTHDGVCERCKGGRLHQVVAQRCIKGSRAASAIIFAEAAAHRLMKTYQRSVDRFVSPSRFYIDKFAEWGWDRERFAHIPNHIAPHEFTPADPSIDGAGEAFVYFGRLSPEKGVETMIRAAARADVPLWLVVTGADAVRLRDVAVEVGADLGPFGFTEADAFDHHVEKQVLSAALIDQKENFERRLAAQKNRGFHLVIVLCLANALNLNFTANEFPEALAILPRDIALKRSRERSQLRLRCPAAVGAESGSGNDRDIRIARKNPLKIADHGGF